MVPTPPPSSPAPGLDRVWGCGEGWGGEGQRAIRGWREGERLVGSERHRIPVVPVLPRAVVLIKQGKTLVGFKIYDSLEV